MRKTQQWWNLGGVLHKITHHSLNSLHLVCFYYQSITKMPTGRHRDFWSTSKGEPVFSKLFRLEGTDPLSFGPEFSEILVELIAPTVTSGMAAPSAMTAALGLLSRENQRLAFFRVQDHLVFTKPLTHLLVFFVGICMNCVTALLPDSWVLFGQRGLL